MHRTIVVALVIWLTSTLLWWAFAFLPLPSTPPEWIVAAQNACFGRLPNGLPEPWGWMNLILSPITLLIAIMLIWSPQEALVGWRKLVRSNWGKVFTGFLLVTTAIEAGWVARKISNALQSQSIPFDLQDVSEDLPIEYPMTDKPTPNFKLINQFEKEITNKTFIGKPVVVTFAFAHCSSVCPLVLQRVLEGVTKASGAEILVITLDPWRDKPSRLKDMARDWNLPEFAHVLSSQNTEDVTQTLDALKVPWSRDEKTGDITHPGLVFILNSKGNLAFMFNNPKSKWLTQALNKLAE